MVVATQKWMLLASRIREACDMGGWWRQVPPECDFGRDRAADLPVQLETLMIKVTSKAANLL